MKNKIQWPEGKKSAGMITIELDGELIWLLLDPTNEKRPATLSMGTYGLHRGLDRMLDSLADRKLCATFFIPGLMAERYPESIKKVVDAGHEIALHGYELTNYGLLSPLQQRQDMQKGIAALEKVTGKKPAGFRLPEGNMTPETLGIIEEMGFSYDSSMLDDTIPYRIKIDGRSSSMVEIPMRWELQDWPYFAFNFHPPFPHGVCRIANYSDVMDNWLTELKGYDDRGFCYVIKFDPQSIGSPARISMFDEVLDNMLQRDMWIANGEAISAHFRQNTL